MYYAVCILHILFVLTSCGVPPSVSKRYRPDYQYNHRTDAFYKLHIESRRQWQVKSICETEGASLMVPTTNADIIQAHSMFKQYPDLGLYAWVASDGREHESAEETPIINLEPEEDVRRYPSSCDVMTRDGKIEELACYRELPFFCKVEAKDALYDSRCNVFGSNYHYNSTVGGCYSIPRRVGTWNEAYAECRSQGAHLVVLNSDAERAVVHDLMQTTPRVEGTRASWFFFAGFRANKPVGTETLVFRTIFNETLTEAGFAVWSPGEPNNAADNEFCGTLFKNDGLLNDVYCEDDYAFICEKEVPASA